MKSLRFLALMLALIICAGMLCGCSSRNVQEELPGEWFVWHWYYNTKDGDNGFFDVALFYTFSQDGKLVITSQDESVAPVEADYEFTTDDEIEVVYADGTIDTFQLIPSEHDGVDQIQFMNTNTNYTLTLEPISTWEE